MTTDVIIGGVKFNRKPGESLRISGWKFDNNGISSIGKYDHYLAPLYEADLAEWNAYNELGKIKRWWYRLRGKESKKPHEGSVDIISCTMNNCDSGIKVDASEDSFIVNNTVTNKPTGFNINPAPTTSVGGRVTWGPVVYNECRANK